jgi:predicted AAA+ superfamily ATPase
MIDWNTTIAAVWRQRKEMLRPVVHIDPIGLDDLLGIDPQKQQLLINTERFLSGKSANNALLWGARGTGKSSLIKAMLNGYHNKGLRLIEVDKLDLVYLPEIVDDIRMLKQRFIIFCDDLSFEANDSRYKSLKSVLEGSIELPPDNVKIYATSNRRHLMPEYMRDNLDSHLVGDEVHYSDTIEETISLADRFGLRLGFYPQTADTYLAIINSLFLDFTGSYEALHKAALDYAHTQASKSGRTAKQFYNATDSEKLNGY